MGCVKRAAMHGVCRGWLCHHTQEQLLSFREPLQLYQQQAELPPHVHRFLVALTMMGLQNLSSCLETGGSFVVSP